MDEHSDTIMDKTPNITMDKTANPQSQSDAAEETQKCTLWDIHPVGGWHNFITTFRLFNRTLDPLVGFDMETQIRQFTKTRARFSALTQHVLLGGGIENESEAEAVIDDLVVSQSTVPHSPFRALP